MAERTMDASVFAQGTFEQVLGRIADAAVRTEPFPHLIVPELLPADAYHALLEAFPPGSEFRAARYPGTGYGRRSELYRDHGLACLTATELPLFRELTAFFHAEPFARTLLDQFSRPEADGACAIPADKHIYFAAGASDFTSVLDLQIDLPGYAIAPHPDIAQKIVTFQLFLEPDDELREFGTMLLRPNAGAATARRSLIASIAGRAINKAAGRLGRRYGQTFRRLEQSRLGLWLGVGGTADWLPWHLLEVVAVVEALPNQFLAFAPSERSYHAVRFDPPSDAKRCERAVIRGFIRSGHNTQNWITPL